MPKRYRTFRRHGSVALGTQGPKHQKPIHVCDYFRPQQQQPRACLGQLLKQPVRPPAVSKFTTTAWSVVVRSSTADNEIDRRSADLPQPFPVKSTQKKAYLRGRYIKSNQPCGNPHQCSLIFSRWRLINRKRNKQKYITFVIYLEGSKLNSVKKIRLHRELPYALTDQIRKVRLFNCSREGKHANAWARKFHAGSG